MKGALHLAQELMGSVFLDGEGTETSKAGRQNFQSIESTRWLEQARHNWWAHSGIIREDNRVLKVWVIYDMGITWLFRLSNDYEMTMRTLIITERFDRRQLRSI